MNLFVLGYVFISLVLAGIVFVFLGTCNWKKPVCLLGTVLIAIGLIGILGNIHFSHKIEKHEQPNEYVIRYQDLDE